MFFFDFDNFFQGDNILALEVDDFIDFRLIDVALEDCIKKFCGNWMIGEGVCRVGKLDNMLLNFFNGRPV